MPPRFAYKERRSSDRRPILAVPLLRDKPPILDYFFANRPRFNERKFAGTNSPSFRISFPSK